MIDINYVLRPYKLNKRIRLNWFNLWSNKCDYIINYYENIKGKYKIIDDSIDYYIAMMEASIYYVKEYNNYYDYAYIQHEIIIDGEPFIKEDIKERDFAEYLKYLFYKNKSIDYIYELIDNKSMFNYDLVVARLLFPSYYLYYLERVILYDKDYDKLEKVVNKANEYENYFKSIINIINKKRIKKIVLPF